MQLYCTLASTYLPAGHELSQSIEQRPSEPGLVLLLLFYRVETRMDMAKALVESCEVGGH